ncbi:hypothetical protein E6H34_00835 [Candidatus Bathyarchaeota archaeon]|nr:MAG: hypothetical protein E6H34_00835 [Candidatus Bathyarchaeota archaeon]
MEDFVQATKNLDPLNRFLAGALAYLGDRQVQRYVPIVLNSTGLLSKTLRWTTVKPSESYLLSQGTVRIGFSYWF